MPFSLRRLGAFAAVCSASLCAHATQVPLVADAHVNATRSSTNFGSLANLYIGNGNTGLLQFDLTSLPAGIIPAQVSRATLTLFVNRVNASGPVTIAPATTAWSEAAVTFATQPTAGAAYASFTPLQAGQYVTVDITAQVQAWIANPSSNDGLVLTSSTANVLLDSKENDQTGHPASLDITVANMGATGATGATGTQGLQGIPGLTGAQGAQGLQGLAGSTGATGIQGLQGITGATGLAGVTGATGILGATGIAGVTGATGFTGATGAQGVTGVTGNTVGGNYNLATTYFPGSVVNYGGQTYLGLNANNGITPGTDPTIWSLVSGAGMTGATGATGSTGPQGLIGPQGLTGYTGATGVAGNTGVTGATGNLGATGSTGVTGATGVAGATGSIGVTGNVGSTGVTGATGVAGATGALGATGSIGNTGLTGVTGATGVAGATGAIGVTGANGSTGITGMTGITGSTGSAGSTGATGITYMGTYSNSTTYATSDVVLYNNTLYYNTFPGNTPTGTPPVNTTYWSLLLPQGATGPTGVAGNDGNPGPTGATGPAGSGSTTPLLVGHNHLTSTSLYYMDPTSNAAATASPGGTATLGTSVQCTVTVNITDYFYGGTTTWQLYQIAPSLTALAGTVTAIGSNCQTTPGSNYPASCTVSSPVTAGSFFALGFVQSASATNNNAFFTQLSCQ